MQDKKIKKFNIYFNGEYPTVFKIGRFQYQPSNKMYWKCNIKNSEFDFKAEIEALEVWEAINRLMLQLA